MTAQAERPAEPGAPLVCIDDDPARPPRISRGVALRTPLAAIRDRRAGGPRSSKAESLQPIGAFKIRGAYHAIATLTADGAARAASITLLVRQPRPGRRPGGAAARRAGGRSSCRPTRRRSSATGSRPTAPRSSSSGRRASERQARRRASSPPSAACAIIPPYDDDRIIAGQGTCGLEIAEDVPDLAAVLVPIGGGGLASGVAAAVRALRPGARIIGVEPELAADARDSLREGRIVRWPAELVGRTIADGTRTQAIGQRTFAHLSRLLDGIVTVSEAEIAAAVRLAAEEARLVVEPSGALAIAAAAVPRARGRPRRLDRHRSSAVVSGGNVDPERYRELLGRRPRLTRGLGPRAEPRRRRAGTRPARGCLGARAGSASTSSRSRMPRARRRPRPRGEPRRAPRAASSPTITRRSPAMNTRSPTIHMSPPASCWSASAVGAPRRAEVRVVGVQRRRRDVDRQREERVLGHLEEQVHRPDRVAASARAPDRRPTAGHQNSSAGGEVAAGARARGRPGPRASARTAARSGCPT